MAYRGAAVELLASNLIFHYRVRIILLVQFMDDERRLHQCQTNNNNNKYFAFVFE